MPKSITTTSQNLHPKSSGDDNPPRLSDVALRKKKNADAQAAFRARRANYIATLEATVTSLESVVLVLQDTVREGRRENLELRQENNRIRDHLREHEKYWRMLTPRKHGPTTSIEPSSSGGPTSGPLVVPPNVHLAGYHDDSLTYRPDEPCSTGPFGASDTTYSTSASISLPEHENGAGDEHAPRLTRYGAYSYSHPVQGSPRDTRWPLQVVPVTNTADSGAHTPVYLESPTIAASEMTLGGYPPEEQKPALQAVLDRAPYAFAPEDRFTQQINDPNMTGKRSMSPTPASLTSMSSTAFTFNFPEPSAPSSDRRDFDFRRHSLPHELALHGGTADISMTGVGSDAVRYRLNPCRDVLGHTPSLLAGDGNGNAAVSPDGRGSGDPDELHGRTLRRRRGTIPSSRSPTPGYQTKTCTVAVIKGYSFGALRRTRTRGKRSSEGAAKVAMDVLEARGIGPSSSSKRQRTDDEDVES
ncbi:hypothetical protein FA15DRAFT_9296 [Coprinopsis marcescibilis]|uniref:BZIP domain-containing protein n=1 Tax=Coprinopsis marcescibilis TaxID=230819 RepID=A0A5C3LCE0_COPMA|nr:hypothetical protein FA15DRAFT_9296 [Coprinopsis marcescibilis]